jgi:hypothetical protein
MNKTVFKTVAPVADFIKKIYGRNLLILCNKLELFSLQTFPA